MSEGTIFSCAVQRNLPLLAQPQCHLVRYLPEALPREVQRCIDESGGFGVLVERSSLPDDFPNLLRIFKALSDDLRWQIMSLLTHCLMCACILKSVTSMSDSWLSYHLNILKKAMSTPIRFIS